MGGGQRRKVGEGPHGEEHQPNKEKRGKGQDPVNHLAFRNQVHEKAGDQERFGGGDDERDSDVDFAVGKMNEGGPNREDGADDQRDENVKIAPDMVDDAVGV